MLGRTGSARGDARRRRGIIMFAGAALTLLPLAGCAAPQYGRCAIGEQAMMLAQLYFGRNVGARHGISDAQFAAFVDEVIVRRFPAGLTRISGTGHWQAADRMVAKEQAEVVTLVLPDSHATHESLEAVRQDYMSRFDQESVLLTHQPVCTHV